MKPKNSNYVTKPGAGKRIYPPCQPLRHRAAGRAASRGRARARGRGITPHVKCGLKYSRRRTARGADYKACHFGVGGYTFWPFGTPGLQAFWCQSIKMYDFYTPRLAPNGSDYIAQNASKRGFFANHSGMRRRSPPNGRKGIRASDTRLSSRGPHSGRWCATGAPHPGTGVPWRGSYAVSLLPAPFPRYGAPRVPLGKA